MFCSLFTWIILVDLVITADIKLFLSLSSLSLFSLSAGGVWERERERAREIIRGQIQAISGWQRERVRWECRNCCVWGWKVAHVSESSSSFILVKCKERKLRRRLEEGLPGSLTSSLSQSLSSLEHIWDQIFPDTYIRLSKHTCAIIVKKKRRNVCS